MSARRSTARVLVVSTTLGLLAHACSAPVADDRIVVHAPGSAPFKNVGLLLDTRCGSLDCHGSMSRNLRLYGKEGLRLDPTGLPGASDTTQDELDLDYRAVVGLEPEVMRVVVAEHGAHPERLILIRKARGTEKHLGGTMMQPGDDEDLCVTSWLAGKVDDDACARAIAIIDPPP